MVIDGVTEYCEGMPVEIERDEETDTIVLRSFRESGLICVAIDVMELLGWFKRNRNWERLLDE